MSQAFQVMKLAARTNGMRFTAVSISVALSETEPVRVSPRAGTMRCDAMG